MTISSLIVEIPVAVLPWLVIPHIRRDARDRLLKAAERKNDLASSVPIHVSTMDGCGQVGCLGISGIIVGDIVLLIVLAPYYLLTTGQVPSEMQPTEFGAVVVAFSWIAVFVAGTALHRGWLVTTGMEPDLARRVRAAMLDEKNERERKRDEAREKRRQKQLERQLAKQVGVPVVDTSSLDGMSGEQFERLCGQYFDVLGYQVSYTPAVADGGIDLVLKKGGERIVVQCKRHAKPVGEPVVRDLYGVVLHEGANRGIVCSSSGFTASAVAWAQGKPMMLIDGREVLRGLGK